MDNLCFTIWLVLFPLTESVSSYYDAKTRVIDGREHVSKEAHGVASLIRIVLWVGIAILLYK